jgi:uncharacterized protein YdaU (DUF1376 family)
MKRRLPYFPLYPRDFLEDAGHLPARQQGIYLLLLARSWHGIAGLDPGLLPASPQRLTNLIGSPTDDGSQLCSDVEAVLTEFWRPVDDDPDLVANRRLVEEAGKAEAYLRDKRARGARGGQARVQAATRRPDGRFTPESKRPAGPEPSGRLESVQAAGQAEPRPEGDREGDLPEEGDPSQGGGSGGAKRGKGTGPKKMPDDFADQARAHESLKAWCLQKQLVRWEVEEELEAFVIYWRNRDGRKRDWIGTFRNRLQDRIQRGLLGPESPRRRNHRSGSSRAEDRTARNAAVVQRAAEEEETQ